MTKMAGKVQTEADAAEQARRLTEEALELYDKGKPKEADQLVERALALDRAAVEEVVQELDEDAETRGV